MAEPQTDNVSAHRFLVQIKLRDYEARSKELAATRSVSVSNARVKLGEYLGRLSREACQEAEVPFDATDSEFLPRTGIQVSSFETVSAAHGFAMRLLQTARKRRSDRTASALGVLQLVVHGGNRRRTASVLAAMDALLSHAPADGCLMSSFAWSRLPGEDRRSYRRETQEGSAVYLAGASTRASFVTPVATRRCFIVMPFRKDQDGDEILRQFIEPGVKAANFDIVRSDWEPTQKISEQLIHALQWDPMAVAYVASPPWNPNVMVEIGVRIAADKPIVILRNPVQPGEEVLPFDLKDFRVIELPAPKSSRAVVAEKVQEIAHLMRKLGEGSNLLRPDAIHPHPVATVLVDNKNRRVEFIEGSPAAEELFQCSLQGQSVDGVVSRMAHTMSAAQFRAFQDEQKLLIKDILYLGMVSSPAPAPPRATIPLVFTNHGRRELAGRAFLPIIVRVTPREAEASIRLLYLDVTGVARRKVVDGKEVFYTPITAPAHVTLLKSSRKPKASVTESADQA